MSDDVRSSRPNTSIITPRYLVAIGLTAAATVARWLLTPVLGDDVPYITYFVAVVIAGWYGGLGPSITAALLGGLAAWFFFLPVRFSFALARPSEAVGLVVYFAVTLAIAWLSGAMHTAQRRSRSAERRAVRQRETLRITLASIGDAVVTTDAAGAITFINSVGERLLGWTSAQAEGVPLEQVLRIVNEQTRQPAPNPVSEVLRTGNVVGLANHTVLIARDGTERPIDDSAAPIRDEQGQVIGVVLVFRDISTRRHSERLLRQSEQELSDFFENGAIALHWVGPDGRILRANRTELSMLGYERDEYIGRHIAEFHVDQDVIADILTRLARGEDIVDREARMRRKDGAIRTVLINANVLWEEGRFIHTRCFTLDVTEQREAETRSRQLAAIVDSSEDAIVSKNLDGIIQTWNRAAQRLFGYTAEEIIGQSVLRIIPTDNAAEEPEILSRIRRGEKIEQYETVRQRKDGRLIPIALTVSPIVDEQGRIVGVSKIARDITLQRQTEEALREADRRKDEFLALLAHELRNPLAAIRNALQILEARGGEEPLVRMMQRQLGHIVRLIDDLLDVSRISQGKIALRKERIDITAVIRDAVEVARPVCDSFAHTLTVEVPPGPIYVDADPNRLTQVIGNLMDNACKFTPHGGKVSLRLEPSSDTVVITVQDNGIGIAEDKLPRIFEMFMQADTSLERAQSGLGLGLTLAKSLVDMHGGTLSGHSTGLGQGSTFSVRLPLSVGAPVATPAESARTPQEPLRILVVDDNHDSADSLAILLELSGHAVSTAYDGVEAVEVAARCQPHVILLDIGLPRLNGFEAAQRIRALPDGGGILLVALTGWGQDADRRKSESAGFDAHLVKPVSPEALTQVLSQWTPPA